MTAHTVFTEPQWASLAAAAAVNPSGGLAPCAEDQTPVDGESGWVDALRLLGGADVRVDLLAARGQRGWQACLAAGDDQHVGVVRTLAAVRRGDRVGIVPGVEIGRGSRVELLGSVLRLVPDLTGDDVDPDVIVVPTAQVGAVIAAGREGDTRIQDALLEQLGWSELPAVIASLDRLHGDITISITATGRPTRIIRLVHGADGWVSMAISQRGVSYRRATAAWLKAELLWELASAADAR